MIKLCAIDCDGTLLNQFRMISAANKKAIHHAQQKGVMIALATGRAYENVEQFIKPLNLDQYPSFLVTNNGQRTLSLPEKTETVQAYLTSDDAKLIYRFASEHEVQAVFSGEESFSFYSPDSLKYLRNIYRLSIRLIPILRPLLNRLTLFNLFGFLRSSAYSEIKHEDQLIYQYDKFAFCHSSDKLDQILALLPDEIKNRFEIMRVSNMWVDIVPKDVSKGTAIENIMKRFGIQEDEVMVLGDSENDISMLTRFHHSVAMGNAPDAIKAHANYVTESNRNDGVAKAIERFCLK